MLGRDAFENHSKLICEMRIQAIAGWARIGAKNASPTKKNCESQEVHRVYFSLALSNPYFLADPNEVEATLDKNDLQTILQRKLPLNA
jgi:hypothetical protein